MENSIPVSTKWLKILRNRSEYIITSWSRVVVQNFTEIGSPILGEQIGEVSVFTCVSYAEARNSYRLDVRLSVRLSVRHTLAPYQNG